MFLKFINHDDQHLTVETNSYQLNERSPELKFILANVVKGDTGNGESPTEFVLSSDSWITCFVMNERGETIDRVSVLPKAA